MVGAAPRRDIDGLRAVAIIPVVLFHSGVSALAGGFAGVDIFFVVSGYLITGILFRELSERGRIDILGFYARRVRRLFPSLLLVVATILIAGAFLLSPSLFEVHSLAKSAVASLGFAANFYFMVETGDYFAADARTMPLLHVWSLAVEEQYYLIWPVIMIAAGAGARRFGNLRLVCLAAVLAITAISLALCAWLTPIDRAAAFYLPVTRAWELGVGSALALLDRRPKPRESVLSGIVGLGLVAAALFVVREGAGFPFPMAVLPVAGTALLIWAGQGEGPNPAGKVLALPVLRSIGGVSYAWYLWHWPLLSFVHLVTVGQASLSLKLGIAVASLVLSYATVGLFENRVRFELARRASAGAVVSAGFAATALVMLLAVGLYAGARFGFLPGDERIATAFADRPVRQELCLLRNFPADSLIPTACLGSEDRPTLVLWGDSHADQWAPAIAAWQASHPRWQVEQITLGACPPLLGLMPTDPSGVEGQPYGACRRINDVAMERLASGRPSVAVLGGNWLPRAGIQRADSNTQYFSADSETAADSLGQFETGLARTVGFLRSKGIPAIVVLQSPNPGVPAAACVQRLEPARCASSRADFTREAEVVNRIIRRVAWRHAGTQVLDPAAVLCDRHRCSAEIDGTIAYYDAEHVSASMAASPRSLREWVPILDSAAAAADH